MGHRFADLLFSEPVKAVQTAEDSRARFEAWDAKPDFNYLLRERESDFLRDRDSFYLASVSPDEWPYIQHRGGPKGFIKVLDERHIGFADFRGNRQYISTGNVRANDRVALFFMDYANRRRLKMLGHAREVGTHDPAILQQLQDRDYPAVVERGFVIQVVAFDWNCSQHITPRYDQTQIDAAVGPLLVELNTLKSKEPK